MDYNAIFGGGPMAAHYSMQDRDLERAKASQAMETQRLSNLFQEQQRPMQLEQQRLTNEGLAQSNQQKKFNWDEEQKLAPMKFDDEQRKFILSAKKSELDGMQLEAQRMAYSQDPKISAEGQRMLGMHKDFLKLREQGDQKEELAGIKAQQAQELARLRAQLRPAPRVGGGGGGGATKPLGMDKLISKYSQAALEADAAGDTQTAQRMWAQAQAASQMYATRQRDTGAGKPTITPEGTIGTSAPRAAPQLPSGNTPAAKPSLPSGWVMK